MVGKFALLALLTSPIVDGFTTGSGPVVRHVLFNCDSTLRENQHESSASKLQLQSHEENENENEDIPIPSGRRAALRTMLGSAATATASAAILLGGACASADEGDGGMNVDNFLKSGMVSQPMGVSGQAGKSRPETGVVLRDGSDITRDKSSGGVLAEILVGDNNDKSPIVTSFSSPWPVATGSVFDVECRNANTGDGAFLSVGAQKAQGKSVDELPKTYFSDQLFRPAGRFSFYGPPTDVKVKKSRTVEENGQLYRYLDLTFSNLSQSTNAEIPRNAVVVATIPPGTDSVVMLVGSASANRWKSKGAEQDIRSTVESFRAAPAPKTGLKVRAKVRNSALRDMVDIE